MLKLQNIVKDYEISKDLVVHALRGVSVDFAEQEFVSVLGVSGCGKTTLLNIIGGLDRYTSGDLEIDGVSTKDFKEADWNAYRNGKVGFVFQSYNLIPHQNVIQNVELALTIAGVSKAERKKRAKQALADVGLENEMYKKPNQLSGGQMQRVALARALVNDPEIVLADEPTGALDSVTSLQVMNILKEISEKRLVIMVTHNAELAEKFSNRILYLHDGEIADIRQMTPEKNEPTIDDAPAPNDAEAPSTAKKRKKRVGMSFFTAVSLSFKNLLTKKGRTIMTSIAASIGLIGVALVLALSNGFTIYIDNMQRNALAGYPIRISRTGYDISSLSSINTEELYEQLTTGGSSLPNFPEGDNYVHIYSSKTPSLTDLLKKSNYISREYYEYIRQLEEQDAARRDSEKWLSSVQYNYYTPHVVTENGNTYKLLSSSVFTQSLNRKYVLTQYDVLYGNYPVYDENDPDSIGNVALIVDSRNRLSGNVAQALGLELEGYLDENGDMAYRDIAFEDIVQKQFKLVYNDALYQYDEENNKFTLRTLKNAYQSEDTLTLNICGILRVKDDALQDVFNTGILYTPELMKNYIENSKTSQIASMQGQDDKVYFNLRADSEFYTLIETRLKEQLGDAYVPFEEGIIEVDVSIVEQYLSYIGYENADKEHALQYVMQQINATEVPNSIYIYTADFDSNQKVLQYLDRWNDTHDDYYKVYYTDTSVIFSNTLGQIIPIISYVLIAFAAISLVVSSVMIGIITYISVIERTKEIGVLRSLGASKSNVSNVFNAETLIIGFIAGVIGVATTYLLCIPINIILKSLIGEALTVDLAVLNPFAALALIVVSCLLTFIGGAIPSRFAAKLDPVKALRTE